ncbi:MAG: YicC/YloC family endoribonuclease [bacterium]
MYSMTGYGNAEEQYEDFHLSVEIKSLNNRYLDINIKLPYIMNTYENSIRNIIKQKINRGKLDIMVNLNEINHNFEIRPDLNLAEKFYDTYKEILNHLNHKGLRDNVRLFNLLNAEGVINIEERQNVEEIWKATEKLLNSSLDNLLLSREREGNETKENLSKIINIIEKHLIIVKNNSEESIKKYEEKLRNKINEFIEENKMNEERVLQEVASMSTKVDINEEINRLTSHINLFKDTLTKKESVGRKLEFITQELHREINTIGAKSNSIEISNIIIEMKTELEKIKEQLRNVE